jgi:uridine kinase
MLIDKYRNTLRPMHDEFIEPTKQYADIIIPNGGNNDRAIAMMQMYIRAELGLTRNGQEGIPEED